MMEIKSLSASSALVFENCESRFRAEVIEKGPQPGGSAGSLGTACHDALEHWVADDYTTETGATAERLMASLYDEAYWRQFADRDRYDEGLEMVQKWRLRQDWTGRKVISTEVKETFDLPTSAGIKPVTFIWDRCDQLANGEYEVVDYKTWMQPVRPADMKSKIQVRVYALAAYLKFKTDQRIWVTLDQLRYEPVSVAFTRQENKATWLYLRQLAERMLASDGTAESLNTDCRYCIQRHSCETLDKHIKLGGPLGISDPVIAARRRYEIEGAKKAMDVMLQELDDVILGHCRDEDLFEYDVGGLHVAITASGRRVVDAGAAARVLGPKLASEFPGGITVGVVDKLLKEKPNRLTSDQWDELKGLIRKEFGDAKVKVTPNDVTEQS